jgi:hypothetical protein
MRSRVGFSTSVRCDFWAHMSNDLSDLTAQGSAKRCRQFALDARRDAGHAQGLARSAYTIIAEQWEYLAISQEREGAQPAESLEIDHEAVSANIEAAIRRQSFKVVSGTLGTDVLTNFRHAEAGTSTSGEGRLTNASNITPAERAQWYREVAQEWRRKADGVKGAEAAVYAYFAEEWDRLATEAEAAPKSK